MARVQLPASATIASFARQHRTRPQRQASCPADPERPIQRTSTITLKAARVVGGPQRNAGARDILQRRIDQRRRGKQGKHHAQSRRVCESLRGARGCLSAPALLSRDEDKPNRPVRADRRATSAAPLLGSAPPARPRPAFLGCVGSIGKLKLTHSISFIFHGT